MTPLKRLLLERIARSGPIRLDEYMALCLLHPEHGYYTGNAPFGARGDFVTAPEISQMFGELLGLFIARAWQDQGRPAPFLLAEPGPGRGTLMADMLRAARAVPGFVDAARIWLIEASPRLVAEQRRTLAGHEVNHAASLPDLPEGPLFLVANEFFDALPIRQFQRAEGGWRERMVGREGERLAFGLAAPMAVEPVESAGAAEGDIRETRPAAGAIMAEIAARIERFGGAALVIDYGDRALAGNTLQAVRGHERIDPLAAPGESDLSAHVDFGALADAATGLARSALTPQGVFLERLGITHRAQALATRLTGAALENHIAAHRRLTHGDEMGNLFKAIGFHPTGSPPLPGLDPDDP